MASEEPGEEYLTTTVDKFTFRVKRGLRYSDQEIWVAREGSRLRLGVTDYLQQRMGDAAFVEPATVGSELDVGDTLAHLETIKATLEVPTPVAGRVVAVNCELAERPELVNEDPYRAGWLSVLETLSSGERSDASLLDADAYFALLKEKLAEEAEGG